MVKEQKPPKCSCCGDPIRGLFDNEIHKESHIGPVCDGCRHNFKIACAYLKHYGMNPCREGTNE